MKQTIFQGYLPVNIDRRQSVLDRKRQEYYNLLKQYYDTRHEDIHQDTFRQVWTFSKQERNEHRVFLEYFIFFVFSDSY